MYLAIIVYTKNKSQHIMHKWRDKKIKCTYTGLNPKPNKNIFTKN